MILATITKGLILTTWLLAATVIIVGIIIAVNLFQDRGKKK